MSDIDFGPLTRLLLIVWLVSSQLGAIPLAWAAARRFRGHAVAAALGGWLIGAVTVPLLGDAADSIVWNGGLPEDALPYVIVSGILPALPVWLGALWLYLGAPRRDTQPSSQ
jgi:hypothetical protein